MIDNDLPKKDLPLDPDNTHVLYRCTCGAQIELDEDVGGHCQECRAKISPKLLRHDLALTMTLNEDINGNSTEFIVDSDDVGERMIGQRFGHFELIDPLGRGGMGQVFRALDTSLQRYVAVKVLRSGMRTDGQTTSSDKEIDLLLQEAVSQARVTHPNIVTIYYVGKQENNPFLAMELINGEPLSEKIERGPLPYDEIFEIAIQISRALQYSFELDIIHGDIKPSNVMVQTDGVAKLSDFGMARRVDDKANRSLGGTPNYIAPEMLEGQPSSVQSDMYALGVTLYETSFGKLPVKLSGRTIENWIDCHSESAVDFPEPWPDRLPDKWKTILQNLLAKDPADRYPNYDLFLEDLESIEPGSQIIARRIPRLIAAMIDILLVLLLVAPIQAIIGLSPLYDMQANHNLANMLFKMLDVSSLIAYTVLLFFWRQSFGRNLMQLRVVNEFGLECSGKMIVLRGIMRMIFVWALLFGGLIDYREGRVSTFASVIQLLGGMWLVADLACLLIFEKGKSLHDMICKTTVVLDT